MSEQNENVRVIQAGSDVSYIDTQRSEAQRAQDEILDRVADHGAQALDHLNKALDWLAVVAQSEASKHRALPVYAQQLIEAVGELRRVRQ